MSLSRGAPNLEELELLGPSDNILDSICASLSRFPNLHCLTLSSSINAPFFAWSVSWTEYAELAVVGLPKGFKIGAYAPESFNEAARDLANGCRTLTVITMSDTSVLGKHAIGGGLSARIVRDCEGGLVKEIKRIRAWGSIIGREEEW
jgi:hypothetical protein